MHYALLLALDIDDPAAPLAVSIAGLAGDPPMTIEGGSYTLQLGDSLTPLVRGSAPAAARRSQDQRLKITSLVLTAAPAGKKTSKRTISAKRLSPFDKYDACAVITGWGLPAAVNIRGLQDGLAIPALRPLVITAKKGKWTLNGVLSVLGKKPNGKIRPRLYNFSIGVAIGA